MDDEMLGYARVIDGKKLVVIDERTQLFVKIYECKEFLKKREIPVEYDFITADCFIDVLIYNKYDCHHCQFTIPDVYGIGCYGAYAKMLK